MPPGVRRDIELERQASLLIHNWYSGKIDRIAITQATAKVSIDEQPKFKGFLNKYKQTR